MFFTRSAVIGRMILIEVLVSTLLEQTVAIVSFADMPIFPSMVIHQRISGFASMA